MSVARSKIEGCKVLFVIGFCLNIINVKGDESHVSSILVFNLSVYMCVSVYGKFIKIRWVFEHSTLNYYRQQDRITVFTAHRLQ